MDIGEIRVGDSIPCWERKGTLDHWNRYAAVNDEFAGHHMDKEVGIAEGFETAIMMAPLTHAYLHAMLREWIDDAGDIIEISIRLKNPLLLGRTFLANGQVTTVDSDGVQLRVGLDVQVKDDVDAVVAFGTAVVNFPL